MDSIYLRSSVELNGDNFDVLQEVAISVRARQVFWIIGVVDMPRLVRSLPRGGLSMLVALWSRRTCALLAVVCAATSWLARASRMRWLRRNGLRMGACIPIGRCGACFAETREDTARGSCCDRSTHLGCFLLGRCLTPRPTRSSGWEMICRRPRLRAMSGCSVRGKSGRPLPDSPRRPPRVCLAP